MAERARNGGQRRAEESSNEFQIGRLKRERVFVPRGPQLLEWAVNVMRLHASRKSVLEIEFQGEQVSWRFDFTCMFSYRANFLCSVTHTCFFFLKARQLASVALVIKERLYCA